MTLHYYVGSKVTPFQDPLLTSDVILPCSAAVGKKKRSDLFAADTESQLSTYSLDSDQTIASHCVLLFSLH